MVAYWERCFTLLLAATQGQCPGWWLGESPSLKVIDVKSKGLGQWDLLVCVLQVMKQKGAGISKETEFCFLVVSFPKDNMYGGNLPVWRWLRSLPYINFSSFLRKEPQFIAGQMTPWSKGDTSKPPL